jgi:hypothetical protein
VNKRPQRGAASLTLWLAGGLWLSAVLGGMFALFAYKETAGVAATAPAQWPAASALPRQPGKPTLVVFAHPRCPCTRATFTELKKLWTRVAPKASLVIAFVTPGDAAAEWDSSDLWETARSLEGATLLKDLDGVEAKRFGSQTSGQLLLYAAAGTLDFAGGITVARGHEGDSPGADRIEKVLETGSAPLDTAPVFGCALHDPPEEKK